MALQPIRKISSFALNFSNCTVTLVLLTPLYTLPKMYHCRVTKQNPYTYNPCYYLGIPTLVEKILRPK